MAILRLLLGVNVRFDSARLVIGDVLCLDSQSVIAYRS